VYAYNSNLTREQQPYINFYFNLVSNSPALSDSTLDAMPYVSFKLTSDSDSTPCCVNDELHHYPSQVQKVYSAPTASAQAIANSPGRWVFDQSVDGGYGGFVFSDAPAGGYVSSGWQQVSMWMPDINPWFGTEGYWTQDNEGRYTWHHDPVGMYFPASVDFTIGLLGGKNGGGGDFDLLISNVTFGTQPLPNAPPFFESSGDMCVNSNLFEGLPAPEPSSAMLLLGLAISGLAVMRRRATA